MSEYVTYLRITPVQDFTDGYKELMAGANNWLEQMDVDGAEAEFCSPMIDFSGVYLDPEYEPIVDEDVITLRLVSSFILYEELYDMADIYCCNIQFVFSNEFGYDPDRYFDKLNYSVNKGGWLDETQCGMNAAGFIVSSPSKDEDGDIDNSVCLKTIVPKDKNEYYLMYMAACDCSSGDLELKDYLKQFKDDFIYYDEFADGGFSAYIGNIEKYFAWLKTR